MLSRTEKLRFFGFSFISLMGMVLLFNLILHYPVRSGMSELEKIELGKKYGEKAVAIEEEITDSERIYREIQKKLNMLERFEPAENNHLTEDQIHRHYQVVEHCWEKIRSYKRDYISQIPEGFGRAIALYSQAGIVYTLCKAEGLAEAKMTEPEFDWVSKRLWEASLFAVNQKLKSGKVRPEEKDSLIQARERLCQLLGLYKEEPGNVQYFPEKLDITKIPRHNVELFLRFKNEVRWRRINFSNVEFDYDDIMNAAQALPE